jgi:hypothetical protein
MNFILFWCYLRLDRTLCYYTKRQINYKLENDCNVKIRWPLQPAVDFRSLLSTCRKTEFRHLPAKSRMRRKVALPDIFIFAGLFLKSW